MESRRGWEETIRTGGDNVNVNTRKSISILGTARGANSWPIDLTDRALHVRRNALAWHARIILYTSKDFLRKGMPARITNIIMLTPFNGTAKVKKLYQIEILKCRLKILIKN